MSKYPPRPIPAKSNYPTFSVGTVVTCNVSFMGEKPGFKAVVYEHYDIGNGGGLSIISENGRDIGGFGIDEQDRYLEYYTDLGLTYHYRNAMQLADDFRAGLFKPFFEAPKRELNKKPGI